VRKPFSVTVLALVMILASSAAAQRNKFTGIIGRTFISDKGVTGVVSADNLLHSGKGLTLEANYGRRLMNLGIAGLTFEVPFAVNFNEKPHFDVNLVPKDYKAFFVTPSLRANIFPEAGLSPWVSVDGGFGHFMESSTLEFGGTNPGKTGTTSGVFQIGGGIDAKVWRIFSVRGEVRDFFSGAPQLNVDTGKTRQHNLFVGGGIVWHF
jgi:hypothetical protein